MNQLLTVSEVQKNYEQEEIITNVSFSLMRGEVCTLLGKNGSGKTTLLKLLTGLNKPTTGTILFEGENLTRTFPAKLDQLGFSIENPKYYEHLTGKENLALHLAYMGHSTAMLNNDQLIDRVLTQVGLEEKKHLPLKKYSLGMKQRLAIARTIIHQPKLIVLDEPFNGLDPKGIEDISQLINYLSITEKMSFIISSHLLHQSLEISDKVLLLKNGHIVLDQSFQELQTTYGEQLREKIIYLMEDIN